MGPLLVAGVRTPGLLVEEAPLPDAHGSLLATGDVATLRRSLRMRHLLGVHRLVLEAEVVDPVHQRHRHRPPVLRDGRQQRRQPVGVHLAGEVQTKVREDFTITEKALTSAFTFKTLDMLNRR